MCIDYFDDGDDINPYIGGFNQCVALYYPVKKQIDASFREYLLKETPGVTEAYIKDISDLEKENLDEFIMNPEDTGEYVKVSIHNLVEPAFAYHVTSEKFKQVAGVENHSLLVRMLEAYAKEFPHLVVYPMYLVVRRVGVGNRNYDKVFAYAIPDTYVRKLIELHVIPRSH